MHPPCKREIVCSIQTGGTTGNKMYYKDLETDAQAKRDHDAAQKAAAAKRRGVQTKQGK